MATEIKCPGCGHKFPMEEAVSEQYKKDLREQMLAFNRKKEEEFQKKLDDVYRQSQQQQIAYEKKMAEEKKALQNSLEVTIRKSIAADFENKLRMLQESNHHNEEKLKQARQIELEFLKKEQELKNREADLEIQLQKKLQEERSMLTEQIRKHETERTALKENEYQLKMRELEK